MGATEDTGIRSVRSRPGRQPYVRLRRLGLGLGSALAYAAVLAYAASRTGALAGLVLTIGGIGALGLVAALVRALDELLPWALLPLGGAYGISLVAGGHAVDQGAPLVAVGLLACGELAAWSLDERWRIAAEEAVVRRRSLALGALALAGLAAATVVVAIADAPAGRGLSWTVVGAVAAVGAVGIGVFSARRGA